MYRYQVPVADLHCKLRLMRKPMTQIVRHLAGVHYLYGEQGSVRCTHEIHCSHRTLAKQPLNNIVAKDITLLKQFRIHTVIAI